jgi:diguanylate cyclase (GGDEF)-like protein
LPNAKPVSLSLSQHRFRIYLGWLFGCCLLLAVIWAGVILEVRRDRAAWHARAMSEMNVHAHYFAGKLHNTIEQIDQLSIRQVREKQAGLISDDQHRQFHLVGDNVSVYPFHLDSDGVIRSSSLPQAPGSSFAGQAFFEFHKKNSAETLRIHPDASVFKLPEASNAIFFTRRVSKVDGSFDGVAVIAVPASYLQSAGHAPNNSTSMMQSVWFIAGDVLTENVIKPEKGLLELYRRRPLFASVAGTVLEPGKKFFGGRSRYLSWQQLNTYPLIAIVSDSEEASLAMVAKTSEAHYMAAMICTLILLLAGLIGARLQIRRDERLVLAKDTESAFMLAMNGAQESFYIMSPVLTPHDGNSFCIDDCNEHAAVSLGRTRKDLLGKTVREIFVEADADKIHKIFHTALNTGFCEAQLHNGRDQGQANNWLHYRAIAAGTGIAVTVRDVTELKGKEEQLNAMAMTDALTLLPNRHWLNQFLPQALATARAGKSNLALLFIDLDDFKKINDTLGHQAGDEFLVAVAGVLRNAVRKKDYVARLGGDEFMVLLDNVPTRTDVDTIADQILAMLRSLKIQTGITGSAASASIGIAFFPEDAGDAAALMQAADMAMYMAKAEGKGQFALYSTDIASRILLKKQLQQALHQAIRQNELLLYYQPRVSAKTGKLLYLEALLRWQHPERGMVAPTEFISLAEESALILEIGNWVADNICVHMAQWHKQGLPRTPVSMNVSAQQLKSDQFRLQLAASMARHGIAPANLAIELTEASMAVKDLLIQDELCRLHEMGIKLQIDHFGTGHSSLSLLQQLQINAIKIDQSFIQAIGIHHQGRKICEAMVQIGKTMGFRVVAEGVETQAQLLELQHMHCDEIQGFLVSPPVMTEKVPALLKQDIFLRPLFPVVQRIVEKARP